MGPTVMRIIACYSDQRVSLQVDPCSTGSDIKQAIAQQLPVDNITRCQLKAGTRRIFNAMPIKEALVADNSTLVLEPAPASTAPASPPAKRLRPSSMCADMTLGVVQLVFQQGGSTVRSTVDVNETNGTGNASRFVVVGGHSLAFPSEYAALLLPMLHRLGLKDDIAGTVAHSAQETVIHSPVRAGLELTALYELAQQCRWASIMSANYDRWSAILSTATVQAGGDEGYTYCPVSRAAVVPLEPSEVEALARPDPAKEVLQQLHGRLATAVQQRLPDDEFVFVRTSCCSPKDLADKEGTHILKIRATDTAQMTAVLVASERVRGFLELFLSFRDPSKEMSIVVLPWRELPDDCEYRCFVHRGRLTALSQYNPYLSWKKCSLKPLELAETVGKAAIELVEQLAGVIEQLAVQSVVLDLAWVNEELHIIELNPFGDALTSGSALFSWSEDRAILYGENGNEVVHRVLGPQSVSLDSNF